jgi:hypothetical protein
MLSECPESSRVTLGVIQVVAFSHYMPEIRQNKSTFPMYLITPSLGWTDQYEVFYTLSDP